MKRRLLSLAMISAPFAAQANELFLDINPDAFHARVDATHASNDVHYSLATVITDDSGELLSLGVWTHGPLGDNPSLTGGLGGKLYALNLEGDNDNLYGLGIGGNLGITLPEVPDLSLTAELFYAPGITLTNDYDGLVDLTIRVNWALFENAGVYAGLRHIEADYENGGSYEFSDDLHVGINIEF